MSEFRVLGFGCRSLGFRGILRAFSVRELGDLEFRTCGLPVLGFGAMRFGVL